MTAVLQGKDNDDYREAQTPVAPPGAPKIAGIEIIELLGRGGMSVVYKARQIAMERLVAVKVLSGVSLSEPTQIKRFQNEAKISSALEHPNIIKVLSFGISQEGEPYLTMELICGNSLDVELKQNGRLSLAKFKSVFLPALSALDYAHKNGVIHRDIKPGNIMICAASQDKDDCPIKLLDFGIAKLLPQEGADKKGLTKTGLSLGSPLYMSPEQCLGKDVDGASDLYSLACVMYEMLRGEPPFTANTVLELLQKQTTMAPPTVAEFIRAVDISPQLAKAILWGLEKEKRQRPASASEWAAKLASCLGGTDTTIVPKLRIVGTNTTNSYFVKRAALLLVVILMALAIIRGQPTATLIKNFKHERKVTFARDKNNIEAFRKELSKKNLSLRERIGDEILLAERLGIESKFRESKIEYEKLVNLYENYSDQKTNIIQKLQYAEWLTEIARCCLKLKQYSETVRIAEKSIALCEKHPELGKAKELAAYSAEAKAYAETKQDEKAEALFKKSLQLRSELPADNRQTVADGLVELGEFYAQREQLSKAEAVLKQAFTIAQEIAEEKPSRVPTGSFLLADVYSREKKYNEALKIYETTNTSNLDPKQRFSMLIVYGRCVLDSGDNSRAIEIYKQALSTANESNDPAEAADAQKHIAAAVQNRAKADVK